MQFKIDENLPVELADMSIAKGHDATTVFMQQMAGESDTRLSVVCREEQRALVTLDVGFSDIRTYVPGDYAGIILLRLKKQDKPYVMNIFDAVIPHLSPEALTGKLWIVDEQKIRVRV